MGFEGYRSPDVYLLHHSPVPVAKYRRTLRVHLINVARSLISCHWKSEVIPSLVELRAVVNMIMHMEEARSSVLDLLDEFRKTWVAWTHYEPQIV